MKKYCLFLLILLATGFVNAQTKPNIKKAATHKKTTSQIRKENPEELDMINKTYVYVTSSFNESNLYNPNQKIQGGITLSDNFIILEIYSTKEIYTVLKVEENEWGTKIYSTQDKYGNYCQWKHGTSSDGDEFVQYVKGTEKITYSRSF